MDSATGICQVPWVQGHTDYIEYQILTNPCGLQLGWVEAGKGANAPVVPNCAVIGGFEATAVKYYTKGELPYGDHGSLSYVGRVEGHDGFLYGGKVHAIDELFYYPVNGVELHRDSYEVLVVLENLDDE